MGYHIDLEKITIAAYREKIKTAYLPPSRAILRELTEERFGFFERMGISNVGDLLQLLKKKEKFTELSKEDCFSGDYLTILLRELNSMLPKPNKIGDFPGVSRDTVSRLEKAGIKNTVKLFDRVKDRVARKALASETGISEPEISELTGLTDLSRIRWVGTTFARMLYDLGYTSVEKTAGADPEVLYESINRINRERNYYRGQIGLNDMRIVVDLAREMPVEIEY